MARIIPTGPDTFQYVDDEEASPQQIASNYRTGPANDYDLDRGGYRDVEQHMTGPDTFQVDRMVRRSDGAVITYDGGERLNGQLRNRGGRGSGGGRGGGGQPARSSSSPDAWAVSKPEQRGAGVVSAGRPGVPPRVGPSELRYSRGGQPVTLDTDDPRGYEKKWKSTGTAPDYQGRPYSPGYTSGEQYGEPQVSGPGVIGAGQADPGYSIYGAQAREPKVHDVGLEPRVQRAEPTSMYVPSYSEDPGYSVYDTSGREPEVQYAGQPNVQNLIITDPKQLEDIQMGLDLLEQYKKQWR